MTDKPVEKELIDLEKLQACCKLMAQIFSKQAEVLASNKMGFSLDEITDKQGNFYGNIKVEWNNDR